MYIDIVGSFAHPLIVPANWSDQCSTETSALLHRVPTLGPAPTVTWHPSRHLLAFCGQAKPKEGGPPPVALVSMFGLVE